MGDSPPRGGAQAHRGGVEEAPGARGERLLALLSLTVLMALLTPVYAVGLATPFRLIDDYLIWHAVATVDWPSWIHSTLFTFGGGRYRPLHDVATALHWSLLGDSHTWHHASRIAIRLLTLALAWPALRRLAGDLTGQVPQRWGVCALSYAFALFLFFPNNPEARLALQELLVGLAFAALVVSLVAVGVGTTGGYVAAFLAFAGLCLAKEPAVLAAVALLPWILWELRRTASSRIRLRFAPFVLIAAHTLLKVAAAAAAGGYGTAPLTPGLVMVNLKYAVSYVLLPLDGLWLPALIVAPVVYLGVAAWRPFARRGPTSGRADARARVGFLSLATAAWFLAFLTSWTPALRYAYPLTVAVVMLNVLGAAVWLAGRPAGGWRAPARLALPLLALLFATATYYDLASQFAQQNVAGRSEHALLARIRALQKGGAVVGVRGANEYEWSIETYANDFAPRFSIPFARVDRVGDEGTGADVLVSPTEIFGAWWLAGTVHPLPPPRLLAVAARVSGWIPLRPRGLHAFVDAGSTNVGYMPWFVYRRGGGVDEGGGRGDDV